MLSQQPAVHNQEIQIWPIDRLIFYARNPRKNDAAVDRMCSSIREFGFKIPVLARSDGEVVDGHLRLKAAHKLGSWPGGDTSGIPVILCDEWTPAQVKAFRLMVNRSVAWADWDEELLALELQELNAADYDLEFTDFNSKEIDGPYPPTSDENGPQSQNARLGRNRAGATQEPRLLAHRPADEPADAVGLPASGFRDLGEGGSLHALDDPRTVADLLHSRAAPGFFSLFGGFGTLALLGALEAFFAGVAFVPDLA